MKKIVLFLAIGLFAFSSMGQIAAKVHTAKWVNQGEFVSFDLTLKDTIKSVRDILDGKYDDQPEDAFYMKGGIEEVGAMNAAK